MNKALGLVVLLAASAFAVEPPSSMEVARTLSLKLDGGAAFDGAKPSENGIAAPAEKSALPASPEDFRGAFLKKKTARGVSLRLPEIDAAPIVAVGCGVAGAVTSAIVSSRNGDSRKDTITWTAVGGFAGFMVVGRTIAWFMNGGY